MKKECTHSRNMASLGQQVISHSGPYFYDAGSLTAADKDELFEKTGVSVASRSLSALKRALCVCATRGMCVIAVLK